MRFQVSKAQARPSISPSLCLQPLGQDRKLSANAQCQSCLMVMDWLSKTCKIAPVRCLLFVKIGLDFMSCDNNRMVTKDRKPA